MSTEASHSSVTPQVILALDPHDAFASSQAVLWAQQRLVETLQKHGISAAQLERPVEPCGAAVQIVICAASSMLASSALNAAGLSVPEAAESFVIAAAGNRLVLTASDERGMVYAVLELADRVQHGSDIIAELLATTSFADQPANQIRSVTRTFSCEPEDKDWYYDKGFWDEYLTELISQRFNRFSLALGMGYDYGHDLNVRDNYFCFSYPFLFHVPGYEVKVTELPEEERQRNYDMLQYIAAESKRRGLHFQLGLWNHAYAYTESPNMNYNIEGIDASNHTAYCRDAVAFLLKEFPLIDGLTFRMHYEGGIPEPNHKFWSVVLGGTSNIGRTVEIDMHAKGLNDELMKAALATGQPIYISPKYWAEHMGPPYHQAAIREQEYAPTQNKTMSMQSITAHSRRFTRYGYADYLQDDREIGIIFRIWPGTQKLLLWGDPAIAAGYGRYSHFSNTQGVDWCEPMTFKGRKSSGSVGGREPYLDESLQLPNRDWFKHRYAYRLWGRLLYNPDAESASWQRYLRTEFGNAASAYEQALAHASRILPYFTAAHLPSAANAVYWAEMSTNMPIVKAAPTPFDFDTPEPGTFGAVSPLDTALFYRIDDFADDIVQGFRQGKYSPIEVAERLEQFAGNAERYLNEAIEAVDDKETTAFRQFSIDVTMLIDMGRFYADKLRAGLAYALYERTSDTSLLDQAVELYRSAIGQWRHVVEVSKDVYKEDIAFGFTRVIRGHWADRLPAIEEDFRLLQQVAREARKEANVRPVLTEKRDAASKFLQTNSANRQLAFSHDTPARMVKGQALDLRISVPDTLQGLTVRLHYRHADQSKRYVIVEMTEDNYVFSANVPGDYTDSPFDLCYFFELRDNEGDAWNVPGLNEQVSNQPYYTISVK
ncbi:hypothetical protein [Paenibacillus cremeus]|uniref:Uncharacterized protein n=1 Tax=Paenibacillus cremeus TaxID=2163881 RepID=A0A559K5Y8_9BACL|nr:hypothetical protein [Paenibacillus cremeus]TVY07542.1 hypothetical protein FPZ49_23305 [Paenibacillus cremeus]